MALAAQQEKRQENTSGSRRRPELELLRCIAMMMVITLHFLGKSGLLEGGSEGNVMVMAGSWIFETAAIGAVNLYMLLSGYFLSRSHFKLSRLLQLLLQVWTYSVGIGLAAVALGLVPAEEFHTYFLIQLLFPVLQEHYWFLTAYVFLYLLLPLVGNAVCEMEQKTFRIVLGLFLTAFCLMKTILPFQLETDAQGYDCLWYLCVFLTAAYIRRFGIPFLEKKSRAFFLYVVLSGLILCGSFAIRWISTTTGHLEYIRGNTYHYNHLLPYLASVCLFMVFLKLKIPEGFFSRLVVWAGPYTLGVYLLHENLGIRYLWPHWFGTDQITGVLGLTWRLLTAVVIVFAVGILVEWLRNLAMKGLHRLLMGWKGYRAVISKIEEADALFSGKSGGNHGAGEPDRGRA